MSKMRAVQVSRSNGPLEIVEREIPRPGAGSIRIKVCASPWWLHAEGVRELSPGRLRKLRRVRKTGEAAP